MCQPWNGVQTPVILLRGDLSSLIEMWKDLQEFSHTVCSNPMAKISKENWQMTFNLTKQLQKKKKLNSNSACKRRLALVGVTAPTADSGLWNSMQYYLNTTKVTQHLYSRNYNNNPLRFDSQFGIILGCCLKNMFLECNLYYLH